MTTQEPAGDPWRVYHDKVSRLGTWHDAAWAAAEREARAELVRIIEARATEPLREALGAYADALGGALSIVSFVKNGMAVEPVMFTLLDEILEEDRFVTAVARARALLQPAEEEVKG